MTEAIQVEGPTRAEAIEYLIMRLVTSAIAEGQQAAQIVGADAAATLTVLTVRQDKLALETLGVTVDEVEALAESIQ